MLFSGEPYSEVLFNISTSAGPVEEQSRGFSA